MSGRALCVLGLGLIGGSLLRAADRAGWRVHGSTVSETDRAAARAAGFQVTDTLDEALAAAADTDALVAVAVPLPAVADVLSAVARKAPRCRLTDVVGVKEPVAEAVRRHTPLARYVGGHPMAGASSGGWASGSVDLFTGAPWVLAADEGTDTEVWAEVAGLVLDIGAQVVPAAAAEHDAAVARVSHLPHVLAAVLASVGADGGPLALAMGAGSFTDGTRVAGSPPELVRAMCEGNRDALLAAVDDALGRLGAARGSLASTGGLAATIRAGHLSRRAFDAVRGKRHADDTDPHPQLDLSAPGALEQLRDIGRAGGRIIALTGTHCTYTP